GWSTGVLLRELSDAYDGRRLEPLPVQYADVALWQRTQLDEAAQDRLVEHWRTRLAGVPPLDLPTDRPRPPVRTTRGDQLAYRLPRDLADPLRAVAREEHCTAFMTLLAAFAGVLARHSGPP